MHLLLYLFKIGLIFVLTFEFCLAQNLKKEKLNDSLLIKEKISLMNSDSDMENGHLNPYTSSAKITYSPDNKLKILVTEGESCGAYCNPYNSAWVYFMHKGKIKEFALDYFEPILDIFIVNKTKEYTDYIVIASNWARPRGFETGTIWNFTHFRLKNEELTIIKPQYLNQDYYSQIYSADLLCQQIKGLGISYQSKSKTINYKYLSYNDETDTCSIVSGYYIYKKGLFVQAKEKSTTGKTGN